VLRFEGEKKNSRGKKSKKAKKTIDHDFDAAAAASGERKKNKFVISPH
jgi:hypothetical protein